MSSWSFVILCIESSSSIIHLDNEFSPCLVAFGFLRGSVGLGHQLSQKIAFLVLSHLRVLYAVEKHVVWTLDVGTSMCLCRSGPYYKRMPV